MKELNSVKKFAEIAPDLTKMFRDYVNECRAENGATGINYDSALSKSEKESAINKAFSAEVEKRSRYSIDDFNSITEFANAPMVRAFADSIMSNMIDMVLPQALLESLGWLVDFKFGGYGDSYSWDVKNNALYAVAAAGRRQRTAPAQILRGTTLTLAPINHDVSVITNLADVLGDRVMLAPEIMKASISIEAQMRNECFDAFQSVVANGANIPTVLYAQNYAENSLISICEKVTAWNQDRKAIIVGTPVALKTILPSSTNSRILLSDKYVTVGHLDTFNGYDIVPLYQTADYKSTSYGLILPDNYVYIVSPASDKLVKCAVGETLQHTDAIYDNANLAQIGTINKEWQTAVITNSVAGAIKLS
jgi:hypothetical protein